jgi:hypothetical protein
VTDQIAVTRRCRCAGKRGVGQLQGLRLQRAAQSVRTGRSAATGRLDGLLTALLADQPVGYDGLTRVPNYNALGLHRTSSAQLGTIPIRERT